MGVARRVRWQPVSRIDRKVGGSKTERRVVTIFSKPLDSFSCTGMIGCKTGGKSYARSCLCVCGKKMSEHREGYCERCQYEHVVCDGLKK